MRKVISFFIFMLFVSSVSCSAFYPVKAMEAVQKKYPDANIKQLPGSNDQYILQNPDGSVWYVMTGSMTRSVTSSVRLFKPRK